MLRFVSTFGGGRPPVNDSIAARL